MNSNVKRQTGILYLMLVIAAISVILLSAFGLAWLIGWISIAPSNSVQQTEAQPNTRPHSVQPRTRSERAAPACENCDRVDAIAIQLVRE